jgi:Zn finger protein HypA/HybF involved in hydrogenase expression
VAEFWCWNCNGRTQHSETVRGLVYKCVQCGITRDLSDPKLTGLVSGAADV